MKVKQYYQRKAKQKSEVFVCVSRIMVVFAFNSSQIEFVLSHVIKGLRFRFCLLSFVMVIFDVFEVTYLILLASLFITDHSQTFYR